MIGVAKNQSAPVALTSSTNTALTVAAVPTGMKAGVRMMPRGVAISPRRAFPSVAMKPEGEGRGHSRVLSAR